MLIRKLLQRVQTDACLQTEEQAQAGLVAPPTLNAPRVRKTNAPYSNLRSALVAAKKGEKQEESDLLEVDDLIEVTEIALLSYCQSVFDRKLAKLRLELRS
jgi:hypothetical protein